MKKIISGLLGAAAAVLLLPAAVSAAEQSDLRWGYTPDGCYYLENVHNDECDFTFEKGTDCRFSCEWGGGSSECLAEMGLKMPDTIRIDEISDIYVYYYAELCLDDANWFGLHCKLQNDEKKGVCREIYTVEAWGSWRAGNGRQIAAGYAGGRRYDYYSTERFNQPTIEGIRDIEEIWCHRAQNPVTLNQQSYLDEMIDLRAHLENLRKAGAVRADEIPESVTLYLENCRSGNGGFCHVNFADYHLVYNKRVITAPVTTAVTTTTRTAAVTTTAAPKKAADADGCYFRSDFEKSSDHWMTRNGARLRHDENNYADGSACLLVTNRTETGSGVMMNLKPYALEPDREYSVRICVMQKAEEMMDMVLHLDTPEESAIYLTDVRTVCGQWAVLETTFTMPHFMPGSPGNLRLYITAGAPNAEFYIDAAGLWDAGCMPETALSEAVSDFVPETVYHERSSDGLPRRAHQNDTYTYVHGGGGLKDLLGPFFRTGFCASAAELEDPAIQALYRQHFNSAACKTELLPEQVIREIGDGSVTVSLEAAAPVLRFAEQNGLGFRGSALVDGSSMPEEMLCGSLEESEALLESGIRQTFALLKQDYPDLDLYAYDVCRNVIPQISGWDADSAWAALSGEDRTAYIIAAFRYARAYAPPECKLFLSLERVPDSEEINAIAALVEKITEAGDYIDGIAVQAHLTPEDVEYRNSDGFLKLARLGLDIQITEMQGGPDELIEYTVPENLLYNAIVFSDLITSVTFYDPVFRCDGGSEQRECGLFDESLEPQILYLNLPVIAGNAMVLDAQNFEPDPFDPVYDLAGDADCDGELTYNDAELVLQYLAEDFGAVLTDQGLLNADVNCDGMITITDVNWILRGVRVLSVSSGTFGANDDDEWRDL